jgi:hypothetical protein
MRRTAPTGLGSRCWPGRAASIRRCDRLPAEPLVYLYASCDRAQTYRQLAQPVVTFTDGFSGTRHTAWPPDLGAFMDITAANELDVVRPNRDLADQHGSGLAALLAAAGQHLSEPAKQAWAAFGGAPRS